MRRIPVLIALLLVCLILPASTTWTQSTIDTSVCEYRETREPVPINPNTNMPYTPDERNQEPFGGASISKEHIRLCLDAGQTIKNHNILFEDYRDAWQELARKKKDYAIPLMIEGGVLHANTPYDEKTDIGGIRLWEFGETTDASQLTEEERKTFEITTKDDRVVLIRPEISWQRVFIDVVVSTKRKNSLTTIFSKKTLFSRAKFSKEVSFAGAKFSKEVSFKSAIFSKEVSFNNATFSEDTSFEDTTFSDLASFIWTTFSDLASFVETTFNKETLFDRAIFSKIVWFKDARFRENTSFKKATFSEDVRFDGIIFSGETSFKEATFSKNVSFGSSTFSGDALFHDVTFSENVSFILTIFRGKTFFSNAEFRNEAVFNTTVFGNEAEFIGAIFSNKVSFDRTEFSEQTWFYAISFIKDVSFNKSKFSKEVSFTETTFKDNADFRDVEVDEMLRFDNTNWAGRVDLRRMSAQELRWDSTDAPSEVKGVFDMRGASIGRATFAEVRFQDVADFSRTIVGQYRLKIDTNIDIIMQHPSPEFLFTNNTFEKETDFLHVTFNGSTLMINNRFRSTLDLTDATFTTPNANLCFSFNRINRLLFEPKNLGNPSNFSPLRQWVSLRTDPLQSSRIHQMASPGCTVVDTTKQTIDTTPREPLPEIYKTLVTSFKDANDQTGINQAWYLQTVATRAQDSPTLAWLGWFFLDIPSRYTVDVWRTVWISMMIMIGFYLLYLLEFLLFEGLAWLRHRNQSESSLALRAVRILGHEERHRAFRLRLFEPLHSTKKTYSRPYVPWRDAATLSVRAFLKIGLGTVYPNTRLLKVLTMVEWLLGAYMLIHFILAVKNNLPSILPFLGTVG